MNKKDKNQKGFSLAEAVISAGLLGVVAYFAIELQGITGKSEMNVKKKTLIEEIVKKNVFMFKARPSSDFPGYNTCILKRYNYDGDLISESASSICNNPAMMEGEASLYIHYKRFEDLVATFSHPTSLKLPTHKKEVYQLVLTGLIEARGKEIKREAIIFKR